MKKFITTLSLIGILAISSGCTKAGDEKKYHAPFFTNPIISKDAPDPCVIRSSTDDYYYIYTTSSNGVIGPIYRSKDMITSEFVGAALSSKPTWSREGDAAGVWAPHVIYMNNLYYYYYTLGIWDGDLKASGIGVATSQNPYGPFEDHGKILDGYDVDYGSPIDQCVFKDDDGSVYMAFGTFAAQGANPYAAGIYYVELSSDGLSLKNKSEGKHLMINDWSIEGPYIEKMNGKWYLFGSGGTCCKQGESSYYVKVYQADSPLGPWKDKTQTYPNTLPCEKLYDYKGELVISGKTSRFEGNNQGKVAGTGHNGIFQDDKGNFYILYHGYDRDESFSGRGCFYDRLMFDKEGFPFVENYTSSFGETVVGPTIYPKIS